jgi:hypothetical protein
MTKARPLPLPPSGISVWRPLASSEGGLVAILGSGPAEGEHVSDEDVQCVWCGLRSQPAAACEVCGSPLYESVAVWQPSSNARDDPPATTVATQSAPPVTTAALRANRPRLTRFGWPARTKQISLSTRVPEVRSDPAPGEPAPRPALAPDPSFRAFRRFAGLDIKWVRKPRD